jgi:acylphosphatase
VRNTDNNKVCTYNAHPNYLPTIPITISPRTKLTASENPQVEGEAQGEEDAITAFLKHVNNGPRHSQVVRLDKEDREVVDGEVEFEIRR